MPAGVSWSQYLMFSFAAMGSMAMVRTKLYRADVVMLRNWDPFLVCSKSLVCLVCNPNRPARFEFRILNFLFRCATKPSEIASFS